MSGFFDVDTEQLNQKKSKLGDPFEQKTVFGIANSSPENTIFAIGRKTNPPKRKTRASPKTTTTSSTIILPPVPVPPVPVPPAVTLSPASTSDSKNHKAIYKIFPSSYPNNKGSYVGKEYIQLLKNPSFMDHFDDVDFYMNALFKNMVNDLTDEKDVDNKGISNKKTPRSILPYFEKVIQFDPTIYKKTGGKKSRKHHRKTSTRNKRNKKQKRRTYKKKK